MFLDRLPQISCGLSWLYHFINKFSDRWWDAWCLQILATCIGSLYVTISDCRWSRDDLRRIECVLCLDIQFFLKLENTFFQFRGICIKLGSMICHYRCPVCRVLWLLLWNLTYFEPHPSSFCRMKTTIMSPRCFILLDGESTIFRTTDTNNHTISYIKW